MKTPVDWVHDEAFCAAMARQAWQEHLYRMANLRDAPIVRDEKAPKVGKPAGRGPKRGTKALRPRVGIVTIPDAGRPA